ncbi:MAG: hypothetical protein ACPL7B_08455 [Candidatus Poribacteria bacterium]
MSNKISLVIVIIILTFNISIKAYFKDLDVGVRPMGMGGAYTAIADDSNAPIWNSAGISQIKRQELNLAYSALYVGLSPSLYNLESDKLGQHFISYILPLGSDSFGLSWNSFQSNLYDENIVCLSYGRRLIKTLYTGVNLKRMSWDIIGNQYTKIDDDIPNEGASKAGYTLDLGFLLKPDGNISIGFSAENIIPADIGLIMKDRISPNFRGGIAYKIDKLSSLDLKLITLLDTSYRGKDYSMDVRIGAEGWFINETTGIRFGVNSTSLTSGLSYRILFSRLELQLDYAFVYPFFILDNFGSHRIAVILRF